MEKNENRADLCLRLLYFLLKAAALMFHFSYQNGGKILSIEKPSGGRIWLRN